MLATTPKARFSVEEHLSDGSARAVMRWRYAWETGTSAVVDIVQIRNGKRAGSVAGTPLATEQLHVRGSRDRDAALDGRAERRVRVRQALGRSVTGCDSSGSWLRFATDQILSTRNALRVIISLGADRPQSTTSAVPCGVPGGLHQ
jgi:hypothetical protein